MDHEKTLNLARDVEAVLHSLLKIFIITEAESEQTELLMQGHSSRRDMFTGEDIHFIEIREASQEWTWNMAQIMKIMYIPLNTKATASTDRDNT